LNFNPVFQDQRNCS